jgi:hypothetical protein
MTGILGITIKIYRLLLRLYPSSFRSEFEEQMLMDFSDLAVDARQKGIYSLLMFCLHELFEFPINLLRIHLEESQISKVLALQPANYAWRSAIGFGVGFAAAAVTIWAFSSWLFSTFDSRLQVLSVWIFDTFHNSEGMTLLVNILMLISSALTGLVFGFLFAFFSRHFTKYTKYLLAGSLGWFIPVAISSVLSYSFGWSLYLSTTQSYVLGIALNAIVGAFLGAISYIAESNHKKSLQVLAMGAILYPLVVYLYTRFLLYLWLEITPWFFPALMILMIGLLSSIFVLGRAGERKIPWAIIVGAIAYPIIDHAIYQFAYTILHLPTASSGEAITPNAFLLYETTWAGVQGFSGVLFGLLLGFIWGSQRKNNSLPGTARL